MNYCMNHDYSVRYSIRFLKFGNKKTSGQFLWIFRYFKYLFADKCKLHPFLEVAISPSIARRILDMFQTLRKEPAVVALPLTQRELEILTLVSKGLLYKEIGDRLQISIGTVKQHLNRIYGKLQVSNKTEAINKLKSWD